MKNWIDEVFGGVVVAIVSCVFAGMFLPLTEVAVVLLFVKVLLLVAIASSVYAAYAVIRLASES